MVEIMIFNKKYKNLIDVFLIVIIAVCMLCPFLSLENTAASENSFSDFIENYEWVSPGTYAVSQIDSDGWCEMEGVLADSVQDFNGDGQDECLLVYISKSGREDTDSKLHALHLAVLSDRDKKCKVTFDINLGVFDNTWPCEQCVYVKEHDEKKYIVFERFGGSDALYHRLLVFHVDEKGKLFTDKHLYDPGGASMTLFSQIRPDYYSELPTGNMDDFSCIYFSEENEQAAEAYGACLNSEIQEFGVETSLQTVFDGQTVWTVLADDALSEICGISAKIGQKAAYTVWDQQKPDTELAEIQMINSGSEPEDITPRYYDVEQERLHIVDIYNEINNSVSSYQMIYGYPDYLVRYNSFLMNQSEDICWLNGQGAVRKQLCHSDNLSIEGYHEEPETVGRSLDNIIQLEDTLVFIFSYTPDGREYRIYFKDGNVIRYIGPDTVKHDYPESLNYSEFYQLWSGTEDGEAIWKSIGSIAPGWWTVFETPDE